MRFTQFFSLIALTILFFGCDDVLTFDEQLDIDTTIINDYITDNNLTGEWTDDGVFYSIEKEGTGTEFPTQTSTIEIIYRGTLLDGTEFDSSNGFPVNFEVWRLIRGWQDGIQQFKADSKGVLLIPSGYGYGIRGVSGIPGNAVLRFDIELLSFSN